MGDYSIQQLAAAAAAAGFSGAGLVNAVAVSLAEDTGMTLKARGTNSDGTVDRGPWQFNSRWHPEVSDTCAYDLNCAAQAAYRVSKQGADWGQWSTWVNGRAKQFMQQAAGAAGGAAGNNSSSSSGQIQVGPVSIPDPLAGVGAAISKTTNQAVAGGQLLAGGLLLLVGVGLLVIFVVKGRARSG